MHVAQSTYLTHAGLVKLQDELRELKNVKRKEIAERIQQAKELGDLSENAEYGEAKNEQSFLESRILELENLVRNAVVIDDLQHGDAVAIGSSVTAESEGKMLTFSIVGSNEVDPGVGKISNESPLGRAFLGRKVGDVAVLETPRGKREYRIVALS